MQGVLRCGQSSGSAQSRPRLGGTQDTTEHVGAKKKDVRYSFRKKGKGFVG